MNAAPPRAPGGLTTMGGVRLVAGRELRTRFTSRGFLVLTALLVVAVVGGALVVDLVSKDPSSTTTTIGFVPATASLEQTVSATAKASGTDVKTSTVSDEADGEKRVRDGDLDVLITGTPEDFGVTVNKSLDPTVQSLLTATGRQVALATQVTALGGDPAKVSTAIASAAPKVTTLEPQSEHDSAQIVSGYIAGILLFMALTICGQLVAQGVVEEKSSRVVELLLAALRPWQLMAGKVIGIGLSGLIQVALVVVAGAGAALGLGLLDTSTIDIGATVVWALAWFVVGFAMYALLLGALGALVSRQEEIGSVTAPVTILMLVPYLVGITVAPWNPDSPLVVALSYIPLCSPMVMPIRIALGAVGTWEIVGSLAISVVCIPVLVWFAGRVYSNAVLRTGTRVKLRDALRRA